MTTTTATPFADAARELHDRGWHPIPLPPGQKSPPPDGYTGREGRNAGIGQVEAWITQQPTANVATRCPASVIGIDVDHYGEKEGGFALTQWRERHNLEQLPITYVTGSRGDGVSGIYWFQISEACPELVGAPVSGVEIVQRHHRYAVMPPSLHPNGGEYRWINKATGEVCEGPPDIDELEWLPWPWIDALTKATIEAEPRDAVEWEPTTGTEMHPLVQAQLDRLDTSPGGRHDAMCAAQMALVRYESLSYPGATHALQKLSEAFCGAVAGERDGQYEFDAALETARAKVSVTASPVPPYEADPLLAETATVDLAGLEDVADEPGEEDEPNKVLRGILRGEDILNMKPPEPMVGAWLDRGMVFSVVGQYGSAKTFALLDMAMSVATGLPWLGESIHHTGPVLYVVAEGGYTIGPRVRGWLENTGHQGVPEQFALYPDRINILDAIQRVELIDACDVIQPALVIIDTMAQSMPGGDENSSVDMSLVHETADRIRKHTGASVGFARHTGHTAQKRGRGFSGYEDNSDVVLAVTGKVKDGPVKLTSEKQKARENPPPMSLGLEVTALGNPHLVVTAAGPDNGTPDDRIAKAKTTLLSAVRRRRSTHALTKDEWIERAPGAAKDVRRAALAELIEAGWFIEEVGAVPFGSGSRATVRYVENAEMFDVK